MAREVTLTQTIEAPVEAVFRAWTDPRVLVQWWGPGGFAAEPGEFDVRPGGSYRILMREVNGSRELGVSGTYREVDPPRRLVFSWRWEGGVPDAMESLVTVELTPDESRTKLVLTHGGFPDHEAGLPYANGWTYSLPRLATLLGRA